MDYGFIDVHLDQCQNVKILFWFTYIESESVIKVLNQIFRVKLLIFNKKRGVGWCRVLHGICKLFPIFKFQFKNKFRFHYAIRLFPSFPRPSLSITCYPAKNLHICSLTA